MFDAVNELLFSLPRLWTVFLIALGLGLAAFVSVRAGLLTVSGAAAAFAVGLVICCALGIGGLFLLCLFFIGGSAVGKVRGKLQAQGGALLEKKGSRRDHVQVAANGLMAAIAALIWALGGSSGALVMFGAAIAEANSDTWAGELGRLSRRPPVSMKTRKAVEKGVSGGVTALGFVSGFAASLFIALFWALCFPAQYSAASAALVCLCGFAGCIADSLLGAYFQALYSDPLTGQKSERPTAADGRALELVQGVRWVDNDMVNILSNAFSALLAWGLGALLL